MAIKEFKPLWRLTSATRHSLRRRARFDRGAGGRRDMIARVTATTA